MSAYVYILQDKNGKFYIGSTKNITQRMRQHKNGHTQTTRNMDIPRLVFSQEYPTLEEVRKVEYKIKRLKRKDYINKMITDGFIKIK